MFDGLIAFLDGIWNGFKYLFDVWWKFFHSIWVWLALIVVTIGHLAQHTTQFFVWIVSNIPELGNFMSGRTNLGAGHGLSDSGTGWCLIMNLFPLDEVFGAFVIWVSAWGVATTYRLVKSWIPTLS